MKRNRKEIIIISLIIIIVFSLGAYLYREYRTDKETPVRAKFVQKFHYYIGRGDFY